MSAAGNPVFAATAFSIEDYLMKPDFPALHSVRRSKRRLVLAALPIAMVSLGACANHAASKPAPAPAPTAAPAATAAPVSAAAAAAKPAVSLYRRLGGYDAIAAFTDDFLGRATNDPVIVPFFRGLTTADLQRIRQHVVDQLCAATGGPCFYPGRDMKTAHEQMEITLNVWNAFTGHLNETVARFKIADRERNELVVIINSLKGDIVNK
jgi:hemoglobin